MQNLQVQMDSNMQNNNASQSPPMQSATREVRTLQIFIIIPSHAEPAILRCKWTATCKITMPVSFHLHSLHPTRYAPFGSLSLFRLMQNLLFTGQK